MRLKDNDSLSKERQAQKACKDNVEANTLKTIIAFMSLMFCSMLIILCFNVSHITIDGNSMYPTLKNGENYMYYRPNRFMKIKRGDIISFKADMCDGNMKYNDANATNQTNYIKRVVAVGGDTVNFDNGKLYVNGKLVKQPYLSSKAKTDTKINTYINHLTPYQANHWNLKMLSNMTNIYGVTAWNKYSYHLNNNKVPPHCYFVLGDNRAISNDSRNWGFVPEQAVDGVLVGTHERDGQ